MTEGDESQTLLAAVSGLDPDLFRVLVAEGSDVIVVRGEDQRLSFVSESVRRALGYSPRDFAETAWDHVHPDDHPLLKELAAELRTVPEARASIELRIQHADGTWRWFELRGLNLLADPTINGVVSNLRDITDRRLAEDALRDSEARFRSVTSGSPIGIYEMDRTPVLRFVNDRWTEITGFQEEDALGKNWQAIIHPEDRAVLAEQWKATGEIGQPFLGMLRVVRPDGEIRWVMAATEPLEDAAGGAPRHSGTAHG